MSSAKNRRAFTLVEVLIASVVLSLFLGGLYTLFGGGQRIAAKASWLQYTIDRLRMTQQAIFKAIKTTSYPSTILPSNIYDAGGTEDDEGVNASAYFVRILPGLGKKSADEIIKSNNGVFLITTRSEPEMVNFQDNSANKGGIIFWNLFYMKPSPNSKDLGIVFMEEKSAAYATNAAPYAKALNLKHDAAATVKTFRLAEDVEWIDFQALNPGYNPTEIQITISSQFYRDKKLTRQSVIKVIPNVGIKTN